MKKILFLLQNYLVLLCLTSFSAQAQGCFYVKFYDNAQSPVAVCQGEGFVLVNCFAANLAGAQNLRYVIRRGTTEVYNSGTFASVVEFSVPPLNEPGAYTIEQQANIPGDLVITTRTNYLQVLPKPNPAFQITRCANRQINVLITETAYPNYLIDWGDGSPLEAALSGQNRTHTYAAAGVRNITLRGRHNLATTPPSTCGADNVQSVVVIDQPNPFFTATLSPESNGFCTGRIRVAFQPERGYRYELWQQVNTAAPTLIQNIENTETAFERVFENLNTLENNYRYELRIFDFCGNPPVLRNITLNASLPGALSLPVAVNTLEATVVAQKVNLVWEDSGIPFPDFQNYQVRRDGQVIGAAANVTNFTDEQFDATSGRACYELFNVVCGNLQTLRSEQACPIWLQIARSQSGERQLTWTAYQNARQDAVSYEVVKTGSLGGVLAIFAVGTDLSFTDTEENPENQILRYFIRGTTTQGFRTESNVVEVRRPLRLFFPNAFTPNQDGLNDTFQPKALFISEFKMTVYTRNGRQLFSTDDISQGWDGTFGQEPLPSDTYIYTAEAADFSGERISTRGTFVLIR